MPTLMEEYIEKQLNKEPAEETAELLLDGIISPKLTGLDGHEFPKLNHLSLIGCGLETLEGLPNLPGCRVVDASENKLKSVSYLVDKCPNLYHLNLCGNAIDDVDQLKPLGQLTNLQVLDVFDCPVAETEEYRTLIFAAIPSLKFLDGFDENNEELEDLDDTGFEDDDGGIEDVEDLEDEDDEEEETGPGLSYLDSSNALKDDDESEDYVVKNGGTKRKAEEAGDVPLKKSATEENQEN